MKKDTLAEAIGRSVYELRIVLDERSTPDDLGRAMKAISEFGVVMLGFNDSERLEKWDAAFGAWREATGIKSDAPRIDPSQIVSRDVEIAAKEFVAAVIPPPAMTDEEQAAADLMDDDDTALCAPVPPPIPDPATVFAGAAAIPPPPTTPVPPPPVASSAPPDYDSLGFPWDERIHSSARGRNDNGQWRYKRGAKPQEIQLVQAELMARMGTRSDGQVAHVAAVVAPPPSQPMLPAAPAPAATTIPAPPATAQLSVTFNQVIAAAQKAMKAGTVTKEKVAQVSKDLGVGLFQNLGKRPDLFGAFLKKTGIAL